MSKNDNIMQGFAERLHDSRIKKSLSQSELGKKLGFKGNTAVYRFESGQSSPSIIVLNKMAQVLGVDLHWLITGAKSPEINGLKIILEPCVRDYVEKLGEKIKELDLKIFKLDLGQALQSEKNEKDVKKLTKQRDRLKLEYQKITKAMRS